MFKIGDKVRAIDSSESGEVVLVKGNEVCINAESGFEYWFMQDQLILDQDIVVDKVQQKDRAHHKSTDNTYQIKSNKIEIDLHFGNLVLFPKNYTSDERLQIQLNAARNGVDKARRTGIKKVILIHGVGQGILKEQLHSMLETMDRLNFFDASFAEYGKGATEVELF